MRTKLGAIALIAMMSCGAAWAQSNQFAGQTPVNTELKKSFSSRDKVGEEINVTTDQDITLGTTKLPKGSTLVGHIVEVTKHSKDDPNGSVTIGFDQAKPKKGDPIAITASVYKLLPGTNSVQSNDTSQGMRGPEVAQHNAAAAQAALDANRAAGQIVTPTSAPVVIISYIPGIEITSVTSETQSAILKAKNADLDLQAGMHMVIGIAPYTK